jgi:hypothetical protein
MKKEFKIMLPFLLLAVLALLAGMWGGLLRLGWALPNAAALAPLPMQHGPLMISGFLGTLIALERVAALRQRWMFAAPLSSGAGWLLSLALPGLLVGPLLITLGSLLTAGMLSMITRREPKMYTITMTFGAFCWLGGNLLWVFGTPIPLVVWWWAAFLVLTIAGERLELNRVLRMTARHYRLFVLAVLPFLLGAVLYPWMPQVAARISGAGMLALAAWLLVFDIARRNLRHRFPLTRFIAACLFSGYFWLGISGLLNLLYGAQAAGPIYDALLHTLFVGFVISMIFGHAPIILPALTRINVPFRPAMYLPLILLHASLVLRIAGDLGGQMALRRWGGMLNEIAILAFMGVFAYSVARQPAAKPVAAPQKTAQTLRE